MKKILKSTDCTRDEAELNEVKSALSSFLQSFQITRALFLCSMLILGNSCTSKKNREFIREETILTKEVKSRNSVLSDDPINVIIKRDDLKTEINKFIDTLYIKEKVMPEVEGISLEIQKNTQQDFAIKLVYAEPIICSNSFIGITDYVYHDMTIYLMSKDETINNDFFELKYKSICEKLEDKSLIINKTHHIQYYEMLRNIPQKTLYYQKKDEEYVLTNVFHNDFDIP
ncbi:MAG TPA: hypothetical protein VL022_03825 [Moheibacter sp.]|nr:hypothetical protein [Moheibacter sp.]